MGTFEENLEDFVNSRFGIFVHYGLYSIIGRGEWILNKEQIPVGEYKQLADRFTADQFDAEDLVNLVKRSGARYLTFTTMHHDGFALYDSEINPFNTVNTACGRDLVEETVEACRRHGIRVHLYHSLNHWTASPDGVDALEDETAHKEFVDNTHARVEELVKKFNPIDCLWYDGSWPFNSVGWKSEKMNEMVRQIQPHILINGRNNLPGDFATPEQHLSPPSPWRPWEACITHNRSWGYHRGDHQFKPTFQVIDMLTQVACNNGNLLFNIGPDGKGRIPEPTRRTLEEVGDWLEINDEAFRDMEPFGFNYYKRFDMRGDFMHNGRFTTSGNILYLHLHKWPGPGFSLGGLEQKAKSCRVLGCDTEIEFSQKGRRLTFSGLPEAPPQRYGAVLALECHAPPSIYQLGGLRVPHVDHPRYNPLKRGMTLEDVAPESNSSKKKETAQ